jgi:hypothetical protein
MARIETSDIDALIDVVEVLANLRDMQVLPCEREKFSNMVQHTRKVYILLLNATEKGQLKLNLLCDSGIPDASVTADAIRRLCPDIG